MLNNALADILYNYRKSIASDMGMGINQNGRLGAKAYQLMEDFTDVASLGRACIKFSVRECTCTSFAEAVIRVRIDDTLL